MGRVLQQLEVLFVSFFTACPFILIVQKLSSLDAETFQPCNDQPCQLFRLFTGEAIPGTAPILLMVQNGVSRPVMLSDDLTTALPVLYQQPVALSRMLFFGYLAGAFAYQWPEEGEFVSDIQQAWEVCLSGVCIDFMVNRSFSSWSFSVLEWKPAIIQHARKMVEHHQKNSFAIHQFLEDHAGTRNLVSNLTQSASKMQISKRVWSNSWDYVRTLICQVAYLWQSGYLLGNAQIVLWLYGESTTSGAELTAAPRCQNFDFDEMQELCSSKEAKQTIINDLASSRAVMAYLLSITMWAFLKAVHDILLLRDWTEDITLTVAIVGLQFQGLAVGSGWMVAIGATEVFAAQVEASEENMPCQCYYTLDPFATFLLMSTPLLLLYTYLCKAKRVAQAILSGDYMHTKTFEIRYDMLRLNQAWNSHDLLLPVPAGHSQQSCPKPFPIWKERALLLSVLSILNRIPIRLLTVSIPAALASTIVFPKAMSFLTSLAVEAEWRQSAIWLSIRGLLWLPAISGLFVFSYRAWKECGKLRGCVRLSAFFQQGVVHPTFCFILLMPPLQLNHSMSGSELQCFFQLWMAAGFVVVGLLYGVLQNIFGVNCAETALSIHADLALFHTAGLLLPHWAWRTLRDPHYLVLISDEPFWQIYQLEQLRKDAISFVDELGVCENPNLDLWEERLKNFTTREQSGYEPIPLRSEEESPHARATGP